MVRWGEADHFGASTAETSGVAGRLAMTTTMGLDGGKGSKEISENRIGRLLQDRREMRGGKMIGGFGLILLARCGVT